MRAYHDKLLVKIYCYLYRRLYIQCNYAYYKQKTICFSD